MYLASEAELCVVLQHVQQMVADAASKAPELRLPTPEALTAALKDVALFKAPGFYLLGDPEGPPVAQDIARLKVQHHITSRHLRSHHITSHHITSHHITSHHITSHHITSHHITSHHRLKVQPTPSSHSWTAGTLHLQQPRISPRSMPGTFVWRLQHQRVLELRGDMWGKGSPAGFTVIMFRCSP